MNGKYSRDDLPLLLTAHDVERYLGIKKFSFYHMIKNPQIPSVKIGGKYYLNRDKFFDYLDEKNNPYFDR